MTKIVNFEGFKGRPFTLKAQAKGYFDFSGSFVKNEDSVIELTQEMKPYVLEENGSMEFCEHADSAASLLTTVNAAPNNRELPTERTVFFPFEENKKYKNVKYDVPSYTNVGCTISEAGIATDFSSSNKISVDKSMPNNVTKGEVLIKANFTNNSSHSCLLGRTSSDDVTLIVRSYSSKFYFACYAGSWYTSDDALAIELNKDYWFKTIWDGTNLTGYVLADDSYTKDTLPELESWAQCWQNQKNIFSGSSFNIGYNSLSTSEYMKGAIDLENTEIKIDGEVFWRYDMPILKETSCRGNLYNCTDTGDEQTLSCWFVERNSDKESHLLLASTPKLTLDGYTTRWLKDLTIPAHDLYEYSEVQGEIPFSVTPVGDSVQYDATTKIFTGTPGSANYLDVNYTFTGSEESVELLLKFTLTSTDNSVIVEPKSSNSVWFGVYNGTIGSYTYGSTDMKAEADKTYWWKLVEDSNGFKVYALEDDNYTPSTLPEMTQIYTNSSKSRLFTDSLILGANNGYSNENLHGTMNIGHCGLKVNDDVVFGQSLVGKWTKK